jgi:hypothetical protein
MTLVILSVLGAMGTMYCYVRSRKRRDMLVTLFAIFNVGLQITFEFFIPIETFYDWMGWWKYPFVLFMILGVLSVILTIFIPSSQEESS